MTDIYGRLHSCPEVISSVITAFTTTLIVLYSREIFPRNLLLSRKRRFVYVGIREDSRGSLGGNRRERAIDLSVKTDVKRTRGDQTSMLRLNSVISLAFEARRYADCLVINQAQDYVSRRQSRL